MADKIIYGMEGRDVEDVYSWMDRGDMFCFVDSSFFKDNWNIEMIQMNKDYLILAALSILAHIGTILRAYPMGYDPYFFLTEGLAASYGYSTYWIEPLFAYPALTAIVFTFIFLSICYNIAKALQVSKPMLSAALLVAAPQFVYRTAIIEDDLLGATFSLLFVLAYITWLAYPRINRTLLGIGSAILGMITWKVTLFYIGAAVLDQLRARWPKLIWLAPLPAIFIITFPKFSGESVSGAFYLIGGLGILTLCLWPIIRKTVVNRPLTTYSYVFFCFALAQARLIWLFAPFAAMLAVEHWKDWFSTPTGSAILGAAIVLGLIFSNVGVMIEEPTAQTIADIQDVTKLTNSSLIANEWQYGHWLKWAGANPAFTNLQPQAEYTIPEGSQYALISHNNNVTGELIKNFTSFSLWQLHVLA